jgi:hypothetical protein
MIKATMWVGTVWGTFADRSVLEAQGVLLGEYDEAAGCFTDSVLTSEAASGFSAEADGYTWSFKKVTIH